MLDLIGQLVDVPRPPREMPGEHRAHLGHRVQQPVARALLPEVREHRVDEPLPVDLPDPLVDPLVAQHGQLVVPHAHVDQHAVAGRGPVHAEVLEDRDRPRHRLARAAVVEVHPDLRGRAQLRRPDGPRHRVEIGLGEEPAHPPRMTRHHQLPLEPPPPKLPPPPLNPPPPLLPPPPPHPPPRPVPPMKGPPQPVDPPVHPRRRSDACCIRFCTSAMIRRPTKSSPSPSRQPKPWVGCPAIRAGRALVRPRDRAVDRVEPRPDAVGDLARAEARGDDVAKNGGRDGVGQRCPRARSRPRCASSGRRGRPGR